MAPKRAAAATTPSLTDLIVTAVTALGDKAGSSVSRVTQYLQRNVGTALSGTKKAAEAEVSAAVQQGQRSGVFSVSNGSIRLASPPRPVQPAADKDSGEAPMALDEAEGAMRKTRRGVNRKYVEQEQEQEEEEEEEDAPPRRRLSQRVRTQVAAAPLAAALDDGEDDANKDDDGGEAYEGSPSDDEDDDFAGSAKGKRARPGAVPAAAATKRTKADDAAAAPRLPRSRSAPAAMVADEDDGASAAPVAKAARARRAVPARPPRTGDDGLYGTLLASRLSLARGRSCRAGVGWRF
jgi:hypothetical protein